MKLINLIFLFVAHGTGILFAQPGEPDVKILKKHDAPVKAVAFSADGSILATGGDDKMIFLWDTRTGELTGSITNPFAVKALQFAGEDMIIAACGTDIKLMDLQGRHMRTFGGYTTEIWSIHYHQPSQRLVAGSYAKSIRIWDFNTGKNITTLHGHEKSCLPVRFSPLGDNIASGSLDRSVRIWNALTGNKLYSFSDHTGIVNSVRFAPGGRFFASVSDDQTVRLWQLEKRYYVEKKYKNEIEHAISGSPLFAPHGSDETKQAYSEREKEADRFLQNLYEDLYSRYIQDISRLSPEDLTLQKQAQ